MSLPVSVLVVLGVGIGMRAVDCPAAVAHRLQDAHPGRDVWDRPLASPVSRASVKKDESAPSDGRPVLPGFSHDATWPHTEMRIERLREHRPWAGVTARAPPGAVGRNARGSHTCTMPRESWKTQRCRSRNKVSLERAVMPP